jgi:hypothetical protein
MRSLPAASRSATVASSIDAPGGGFCALGEGGNSNVGIVVFNPQKPEQNVKKEVQERICDSEFHGAEIISYICQIHN